MISRADLQDMVDRSGRMAGRGDKGGDVAAISLALTAIAGTLLQLAEHAGVFDTESDPNPEPTHCVEADRAADAA